MYQMFRNKDKSQHIPVVVIDEDPMYQLFRGQDQQIPISVGVHDKYKKNRQENKSTKVHVPCTNKLCKLRRLSAMVKFCKCKISRRSLRQRLAIFTLVVSLGFFIYIRDPSTGELVHNLPRHAPLPPQPPLELPREQDVDPLLPKLRVVVFDMSPQTMDDTNLIHYGPEFLVRMGAKDTRRCCNMSISKLAFPDNRCQVTVFGVNMTLKAPWNWAVYNATREAYVLGTDYFLILNDRSKLPGNWAEEYINKLARLNPPNIGIAVRSSPTGGRNILFHRTHIDIFGYPYPWFIHTNSAYNYLENVYPGDLRVDIDSPTLQMATVTHEPDPDSAKWINGNRHYLTRFLSTKRFPPPVPDNKVKVIAMSLYGNSRRYVEGAIRNAQLAPMYFPNWILRFYVPHPDLTEPIHVRYEVIKSLNDLGADIKYVNNDVRSVVAPMMWRFLVADDADVDIFIVQDCDGRIGSRVASGVADWLRSNSSVYCMRDHPWHAASAVSGGMWGAMRADFDRLLNGEFVSEMIHYNASYEQDMRFLGQRVWPKVHEHAYCHDSTSCDKWPHAHPWPTARRGLEHVGEIYNEYHVPFPSNRLKLNQTEQNRKCEPLDRLSDS